MTTEEALSHLQELGYVVLDPKTESSVRTVCDLLYHVVARGKSEERYVVYDRAARNFLSRLRERQPRY